MRVCRKSSLILPEVGWFTGCKLVVGSFVGGAAGAVKSETMNVNVIRGSLVVQSTHTY